MANESSTLRSTDMADAVIVDDGGSTRIKQLRKWHGGDRCDGPRSWSPTTVTTRTATSRTSASVPRQADGTPVARPSGHVPGKPTQSRLFIRTNGQKVELERLPENGTTLELRLRYGVAGVRAARRWQAAHSSSGDTSCPTPGRSRKWKSRWATTPQQRSTTRGRIRTPKRRACTR